MIPAMMHCLFIL